MFNAVLYLIWLGTRAVGHVLRARAEGKNKPKPGAIDPDQMPTVTEARAIPMVWGTVQINSLNILWYGDHGTQAIAGGGYYHRLNAAWALCSGKIDGVLGFLWDGLKPVSVNHIYGPVFDRIFFADMNLFGGDAEGGGFLGELRCYHGGIPQPADTEFRARIGVDIPGWPGLAWAYMTGPASSPGGVDRAYIGTSASLHQMSAIVRRVDNCNPLGLSDGAHDINEDANPANIIWDILTNPNTGLGLLEADGLDLGSFALAGHTLADEEFGLSMVLNDAGDAKAAIEEILRHIDGVLATGPTSGLLELRLIRADYDPATLPVLGEDQIKSLQLQRPSLDMASNMVRVTYTEVSGDKNSTERVVTLQNSAAIAARGVISVEDVSYPAVTKAALAQRLAAREMRLISHPWARISLTTDRTAWAFRQGSVFKLSWPPLGILEMICRVTRISPGDLTSGDIQIEAMEDVFGASWTGYGPIPPNGWDDPYHPA